MQGSLAEKRDYNSFWGGVSNRLGDPATRKFSVEPRNDVAGVVSESVATVPVATATDDVRKKVGQTFSLFNADEDE